MNDNRTERTAARGARWPALAALAAAGIALWFPAGADTAHLPAGKSDFTFSSWGGPPLKVWTHRPERLSATTPIVIVMHGAGRDGDRYRDEWAGLADTSRFILVVPEFPKADFPGAEGYNLGNVHDARGNKNPRAVWTFSAIEPLFDEIKRRTGGAQTGYTLYGHSAGAQFVHRYLYFVPYARVTQAIAANAGWYTLPTYREAFPYGLDNAPVPTADLDAALGKNLIVLLGTADTDTQGKNLRRTPEALAQGPHRYARGHTFHAAGEARARARGTPFAWQLRYAPGVGHTNGLMAEFAARLMSALE